MASSKEQAIEVGDDTIQYVPNNHPEVMGKRVRMKFDVSDSEEWLNGIITTYNGITQKYGVFFPCDKETVEKIVTWNSLSIYTYRC